MTSALALLGLAAACGGAPPEEGGGGPPTEDSSGGVEPRGGGAEEAKAKDAITVKLLDPGAESGRTALRYDLARMAEAEVVFEMGIGMSIRIGEQELPKTPLPLTRMRARMLPESMNDGVLRYRYVIDDIEMVAQEGVTPEVMEKMDAELTPLEGLEGWGLVTDRGETLDSGFVLERKVSPQVARSLEMARNNFRQLPAVLPEEAVAEGARWKVTMPVTTQELSAVQEVEYTLTARDGDTLELALALTQTAPAQDMPSAAPGVTSRLDSLDSQGKGTMQASLAHLVPRSQLSMSSRILATIHSSQAPEPVPMSMAMDLALNVHTGDAK